jgi:hypothetical protein
MVFLWSYLSSLNWRTKNRHQLDLCYLGQRKVIKVLPDDNNESRHQWLLLELPSGQTLLIAHNIDLAAGIPSLKKGETVAFHGQQERKSIMG